MREIKQLKIAAFSLSFFLICLFYLFPFSSFVFAAQAVIVLDPGHAGANTTQVDPSSGIETKESGGAPGEMQNMWDTAQIIKAKLEKDGYKVVLTKNSESDTAGFVTKISRAEAANPDLVVSMHYTGGASFGQTNDHWGVTYQEVGRFRQNKDNGKRKTFTDTALSQKSLQYAQAIAAERSKTGDLVKVSPLDLSFPQNRPDVLAFGDIPIVLLLSNVPWVYNEVGANGFNKNKYAQGIANGIEKAISANGGGNGNGTQSSNCVVTKVGNPKGQPQLPASCTTGGGGNQDVVNLARQHLAGSYIWGAPPRDWASENPNTGHAPTHFDCSGFAGWVWYWATNGKVNIPGQTDAVWLHAASLSTNSVKITRTVGTKSGLQPGDLVFFGSVATTHHVGIYSGTGPCGKNDCFLEWYSSGKPGRENSLSNEPDYVGYVHIVVN